MNICRFAVVRPVATLVFIFLLVVFGVISFQRLTVREFPDIDVPTISIRTFYPGASASVIESKITQIIEDTIAGIDGLRRLSRAAVTASRVSRWSLGCRVILTRRRMTCATVWRVC